MTPERWQEVKEKLAAALERPPEDRGVYLDQACTEPALRREVESLIAAHEQTRTSFLTQPGAQLEEPMIGSRLGPYEILALIGAGGMGVVYRARDGRLDRDVAIKVLPLGLLIDEAVRKRFRKEALALAKLNHPNIAAVYDVGEQGGTDYLVMECVPGQSLAEVLRSGSMPDREAASLGLQVATALEEAHEQGIVHRDLKPGNIMITPKRQAKVLDFGLAKILRPLGEASATESFTQTQNVAGTLPYMAPEQLRGEPADARTDIHALGAVLFELVTGKRLHQEDSVPQLTDAILHQQPVAPRALNARVSPEMERIVLKCLEKEPENRYQSAKELGVDLRRLSVPSAASATGVARPTSRPWLGRLALGAGLCVLVVLTVIGYELFRTKLSPPLVASPGGWVQITDFADSAVSPALSPDGRILTFIRGGNTFYGAGQINALLLPNGEPVQLTHDSFMKMSPEFSPDGTNIAYTVRAGNDWDTWVVPALGGEPRLMMPNAEGLNWIAAQRLLFSEIKTGLHMAVVTASDSRGESRDVYVPPRERGMAHRSALSPDRKWVLVAEMDNGGWLPCRLLPFDGSSPGTRVGPRGSGCTHVAWSPDGTWMYFSSDVGGRFHIWRRRFPNGDLEQVTSGATEEEGIAMMPDGGSLITSVGSRESTLWVRDGTGERQISSEGYAESPRFSPDGKKLYYLVQRNGISGIFVSGELCVADLGTGRSEHLLPGFDVATGYDISPDGTEVVFSATNTENRTNLWLASLDFRFAPRQFSSPVNEDQPVWDSVGHIYFRAAEGKSNFLYRMNPDGSERVRALPDPILELETVTPDGRWALGTQMTGPLTVAIPLDGGVPVAICPGYCVSRWSEDGKTFTVRMDAATATLVVPVARANSPPPLPPAGIQSRADMEKIKGAKVLDGSIILGPKPGLSASLHQYVHRNLYRVPLR